VITPIFFQILNSIYIIRYTKLLFKYHFWRNPFPRSSSNGTRIPHGLFIVLVVSEHGPPPATVQNTTVSNDPQKAFSIEGVVRMLSLQV
jgi:hypothetical protein